MSNYVTAKIVKETNNHGLTVRETHTGMAESLQSEQTSSITGYEFDLPGGERITIERGPEGWVFAIEMGDYAELGGSDKMDPTFTGVDLDGYPY